MKKQISLYVPIALLATVFSLPIHAQLDPSSPWPMFRQNVQHTGLSSNVGPSQPLLFWSYVTGGTVLSSPSLDDEGKMYVGSFDNNVYAFSPTGSLVWSYELGNFTYSSPALDSQGRLYIGAGNDSNPQGETPDDNLYALNSDGTLFWSYLTGDEIAASPTLGSQGDIYVGSQDNRLYFVTSAGAFSWSYLFGDKVYTSSVAIDSGSSLYVGSFDKRLYSLSQIGALRWSYLTGGRIASSPALNNTGAVHFGSFDDRFYALSSAGGFRWSYGITGWTLSSPAIGVGSTLYIGSWYVLYTLTSEGALMWSYQTENPVDSSVAIDVEGKLYVNSADNRLDVTLYSFQSDGTLFWSYRNGGQGSPAIGSDGYLYTGTNDNVVLAFGLPPTPTITAMPTSTETPAITAMPMSTPTPTITAMPTSTPTPTPNYINLVASPAAIDPGEEVTLSYSTDFSTWDYRGIPVDVYLATVRNPVAIDSPSSVADALAGGVVFLWGNRMDSVYRYEGSFREPTWSNVASPPVAPSGSTSINVPASAALAGDYVFATVFIRCDNGQFVRDDGLPVENSNLFSIQ